jgi:hypothetical protein
MINFDRRHGLDHESRRNDVNRIERIEQQLASAHDIADVLAAGWESFEFVRVLASVCADQAADMYPAFMFAQGSAVSGRNAIAFAPSMPADRAVLLESPALSAGNVDEVADALAGLASALSARLREAAGRADDDGDRVACEQAARDAERISELLAGSK